MSDAVSLLNKFKQATGVEKVVQIPERPEQDSLPFGWKPTRKNPREPSAKSMLTSTKNYQTTPIHGCSFRGDRAIM